jgi:peroxiredoxin Q/BCP
MPGEAIMTIIVGQPAPEFTALSDAGAPVRLSDFRGQRVILYFYPKDDTPGCTTQSCDFRDQHPAFTEKNAVILGVSPDGIASHQQFKAKYQLPFVLLADTDHAIAEAYGVWVEKQMYGRQFMGIDRSHFVIDEHGIVIAAELGVKPAASAAAALAALG